MVKLSGLDCVIKKQDMGHYCGYVVLPNSLQNWSEIMSDTIDIHGGITFDGLITWGKFKFKRAIGFDCAHGGDIDFEMIGGKHVMISHIKRPQVKKWLKQLAIQVKIIELMSDNGDYSLLSLKTMDTRTNISNFMQRAYDGS